jgi:HPt (histidine-containing phosphotransfer) domain-containing protein
MERASNEAELLDPNVLRTLREYRTLDAPDPARDVADTFLQVTPERLVSLDEAAQQGNAEEVRRIAHQVRGSCNAVGAVGMQRIAEALEQYSEASDNLAALIKSLDVAFARTRPLLEAIAT